MQNSATLYPRAIGYFDNQAIAVWCNGEVVRLQTTFTTLLNISRQSTPAKLLVVILSPRIGWLIVNAHPIATI
jgi:hypothetical protein